MHAPGLVYFEGEWPCDERELIETAAREAEADHSPPGGPGSPWVIIRKDLDFGTFYLASRFWETRVLSEESAPELADQIRQSGGQ